MIAWSQFLCLQLSGSLGMSQATSVGSLPPGRHWVWACRLINSSCTAVSLLPLLVLWSSQNCRTSSKPTQGTELCLKILGFFYLVFFRLNWLGLFCSYWVTKPRRVSGTATGKGTVMEAVYACSAVGRKSDGSAEKVSQVKSFKKPKPPNC